MKDGYSEDPLAGPVVVRMARSIWSRPGAAAVALFLAGGCTGCFVDAGGPEPPVIGMANYTDGPIEVVSLEPARGSQDVTEDGEWLMAVIPPGGNESINPKRYEAEHCLDVPIVVRDADGAELERIDAGECIEDTYTLNIGA